MVEQRQLRSRRWRTCAALIAIVSFAGLTARLFVWPDLEPVPQHVDAIIELGGPGNDGRESVALTLAGKHRADYLVQSTTAREAGTHSCLKTVPEVTVLCFHADPNTTRGEARFIGAEGSRRQWQSVVLVTTPDQALRARLRTTRCFGGEVYVATAPLPARLWAVQVPYQWAASIKALLFERSC